MQITPLERHILNDEAMTRGLGDIEARMLVEWLIDRTSQIAFTATSDAQVWDETHKLCRRARVYSRFVNLWSKRSTRGAALQLASAERQHWPLPKNDMDPGELMENLLGWVNRQDEIVAESLSRQAA